METRNHTEGHQKLINRLRLHGTDINVPGCWQESTAAQLKREIPSVGRTTQTSHGLFYLAGTLERAGRCSLPARIHFTSHAGCCHESKRCCAATEGKHAVTDHNDTG